MSSTGGQTAKGARSAPGGAARPRLNPAAHACCRCRCCRLVTVERPGGGRALIVGDDAQLALAKLRSGRKVRVKGRWLKHPGRGDGGADGAPDAPVQTNDTACEHASECLWAEDVAEEGAGKAPRAAASERATLPPCRRRLRPATAPYCGPLRAAGQLPPLPSPNAPADMWPPLHPPPCTSCQACQQRQQADVHLQCPGVQQPQHALHPT